MGNWRRERSGETAISILIIWKVIYSVISAREANSLLRHTILIRSVDFPVLLIYITRTLRSDYGIIISSCNRGIRMFLMRNLRYGPWLSIIMLLLVI